MRRLFVHPFRLAALTALAAMAFGQTPAVLTFNVRTANGAAVQNADMSFQPAQPPEVAHVLVEGQPVTKFGVQAHSYRPFFVTKTNGDGQAQAAQAGLANAFPTGKVVVTVRAPGYEAYVQPFDLADQKTREIVLRPLPPQ